MAKKPLLKKWSSLDEAAEWLTTQLGKPVAPRDLIDLASEQRLVLHYVLRNAWLRPTGESGDAESAIRRLDTGRPKLIVDAALADSLWAAITTPTQGPPRVRRYCVQSAEGFELEVQEFTPEPAGPLLLSDPGGDSKYHHGIFAPAKAFDLQAIVVADCDLLEFVKHTAVETNDEKIEEKLSIRERDTLLVIIGALAHHAKIPIKDPAKAANIIVKDAAILNAEVSQRAVQDHLNRVPKALAKRAFKKAV